MGAACASCGRPLTQARDMYVERLEYYRRRPEHRAATLALRQPICPDCVRRLTELVRAHEWAPQAALAVVRKLELFLAEEPGTEEALERWGAVLQAQEFFRGFGEQPSLFEGESVDA